MLSKKYWRGIYSFIHTLIVLGVYRDAPQPWALYWSLSMQQASLINGTFWIILTKPLNAAYVVFILLLDKVHNSIVHDIQLKKQGTVANDSWGRFRESTYLVLNDCANTVLKSNGLYLHKGTFINGVLLFLKVFVPFQLQPPILWHPIFTLCI